MLSILALLVMVNASGDAGSIATIADATRPPPGWVIVSPPTTDREWLCANYSNDLRVESGGNGIQIFRGVRERSAVLKLSRGSLVGVNRGEFGGAVEWQADGTETTAIVVKDNPVAFVTKGARIFAFAGIAHLTIDEGHVLELKQNSDDKWSSKKVLDLGSAPDAVLSLAGGEVVVLTTTGLLSVDLEKLAKRRLFHNSGWVYLYANSIAQLSGSVFVGARRAVIRLRPDKKGYVEEWWVDSRCPRRVGDKCECRP